MFEEDVLWKLILYFAYISCLFAIFWDYLFLFEWDDLSYLLWSWILQHQYQSSQQDFWVQHSMCFIVYYKFNTHTRQSLSNSQTSLLQLSGKHQHSPCSSLEGYHHDYVTGWWHAQKMMVRPITCSTMSNIFLVSSIASKQRWW